MSVCCECCVLSGRGLCDELITCREESYRRFVWSRNLVDEEALTHWGLLCQKQTLGGGWWRDSLSFLSVLFHKDYTEQELNELMNEWMNNEYCRNDTDIKKRNYSEGNLRSNTGERVVKTLVIVYGSMLFVFQYLTITCLSVSTNNWCTHINSIHICHYRTIQYLKPANAQVLKYNFTYISLILQHVSIF